ncbi:hypothetical protein [Streptomyces sp. NPDC050535]|uniref:hypothetical protein n=1 Tax=Streptomyces sp. NPDC050535 TaxID=3365626 RepID=UPI003792208C
MEPGISTDIQPTRESRGTGVGAVAAPGVSRRQGADDREPDALDPSDQESNIIRGED